MELMEKSQNGQIREYVSVQKSLGKVTELVNQSFDRSLKCLLSRSLTVLETGVQERGDSVGSNLPTQHESQGAQETGQGHAGAGHCPQDAGPGTQTPVGYQEKAGGNLQDSACAPSAGRFGCLWIISLV